MHAGYPHPSAHIMSLDASLLSSNIEAAWEQSQSHHTLRSTPTNHHHHPDSFSFGYSAAFPQYTLSPTLSAHSLSSSASSSASSLSPTAVSPLSVGSSSSGGVYSADGYMTMLRKSRMHFSSEMPTEPTCLPTHQLFEFDFPPSPPSPTTSSNIATPPMRSHAPQTLSFSSASPVIPSVPSSSASSSSGNSPINASKRPVATPSATPSTAKKPRTCVSTKDFVPPDVTGLTKREARLVKNRAAAFLSRQRKREEFELMEIRVAELEQENQRLQALAEGRTPPPDTASSSTKQKDLDELRAHLEAARQREQELNEQLEKLQTIAQHVKTESQEPSLSASSSDDGSSSGASTPLLTPTTSFPLSLRTNPKSGASLGLMVLLCALPSLLSSSSNGGNSLPSASSFSSLPLPAAASASILPGSGASDVDWEFDWARSRNAGTKHSSQTMEVDGSDAAESQWKKLELASDDADLAAGLGALDISFDTSRSSDGKIRVRVHSRASSSQKSENALQTPSIALSLPSTSRRNSASPSHEALSFNMPSMDNDGESDPLGPFLGSGMGMGMNLNSFGSNMGAFGASSGLGMPEFPEFSQEFAGQQGTSRRVRIALKSAPAPGGEGGEWEVELR